MNENRTKLKQNAREVLELLERGNYQVEGRTVAIGGWQDSARLGTRLYSPAQLESLRSSPPRGADPGIELSEETTQVAAQRLASQVEKTALLNFASARNPGGGFLNGAKAQEEDLCRCSGLYPCLLECMEYYEANRRQDSLLYTDHMIYSPDVPFFRVRGNGGFLTQPFTISVITAPAPNSRPHLERHPQGHQELEQSFLRRWQNVLCLAVE
ncbi:MAG: TIGR02452 family protein, partial [Planctomycetota bacterium]